MNSIKNQSFQNWECIIVDDGSTDGSKEFIESWIQYDSRFRLITQLNSGVSTARNRGLNVVQGNYIQFLDGDDKLEPTKLEDSINVFRENMELDIVFTNFKMYDIKLKQEQKAFCTLDLSVFKLEKVLFEWDEHFAIPIHCGLIKESFLKGIRFNETLRAKEDWVMWVEVFKRKPNCDLISANLAIYTRHRKSITMSSNMFEDHLKALEYLKTILEKDIYIELIERFFKRYYLRSINFKAELNSLRQYKILKLYRFLKRIKF